MKIYTLYFFDRDGKFKKTITEYFETRDEAEFFGMSYCQTHTDVVNFVLKQAEPIDVED